MCTVTVQSVYTVQSVGARAGAWERASCAWPGLGALLCLARWRRPDSPGQSVSWPPHRGTEGVTVLSLVSLTPLSSHQTSGSGAQSLTQVAPGPGLGWHRCDQSAQPHSQSGEHQCLSAVDSVKVTQLNISCCEVPGCCLKASYSQ